MNATNKQVDDLIDEWHNSASELQLHEYLEWSWEEYCRTCLSWIIYQMKIFTKKYLILAVELPDDVNFLTRTHIQFQLVEGKEMTTTTPSGTVSYRLPDIISVSVNADAENSLLKLYFDKRLLHFDRQYKYYDMLQKEKQNGIDY